MEKISSFKIALYNVWDRHFDDIEESRPESPLRDAPSYGTYEKAQHLTDKLLKACFRK